jgi:hypothetical protein
MNTTLCCVLSVYTNSETATSGSHEGVPPEVSAQESPVCVRCGDSTADWVTRVSEAAVRSWGGGRTAEPSSDQQNASVGRLAQRPRHHQEERNAVPIRGNYRHCTRSAQCRLFQVAHGALALPRSRGRQAHRRSGDRSTGIVGACFRGEQRLNPKNGKAPIGSSRCV